MKIHTESGFYAKIKCHWSVPRGTEERTGRRSCQNRLWKGSNPVEIYLDNSATTRVSDTVAALIHRMMTEEYGNPSCGSEANNLAVLGAVRANRRTGSKVVTTAVEHDSLLAAAAQLEREGFQVVRVAPRSDGSLDPQEVAAQVDENTVLVSVMPPTICGPLPGWPSGTIPRFWFMETVSRASDGCPSPLKAGSWIW